MRSPIRLVVSLILWTRVLTAEPWSSVAARLSPGTRPLSVRVVRENRIAQQQRLDVSFCGADGKDASATLWLAAAGPPQPVVVVLGDTHVNQGSWASIGSFLQSHGFAAVIMHWPSDDGKPWTLDGAPQRASTQVETVVRNLRRSAILAAGRPEIDGRRLGFVGIGMGGVVGALAVAVESRFNAAALLGSGADWGEMIVFGQHPALAALRSQQPTWTSTDFRRALAAVEPATFAPHISHRPLLMVCGRDDERIPQRAAQALAGASRQPKRLVRLASDHRLPFFQSMSLVLEWMRKYLTAH